MGKSKLGDSSSGTVGVIGCGTMGIGIAIVAARGGRKTILYDGEAQQIERARTDIAAFVAGSVSRSKISPESALSLLQRIHWATSPQELAECELIVEAIFEEAEAKVALFQALNGLCQPAVIFATNTSTLSITQLGAASGRPEQFVGLHFCLPAQLMKLVEVTVGMRTSAAALSAVLRFCGEVGQIAIQTRDRPGFILNHFAVPLNNRAIRMVQDEIARPVDIDRALKAALGFPIGPLELVDLVGLDTQARLCDAFYCATYDPELACPPLVRRMIAAGWLGKKGRARILRIHLNRGFWYVTMVTYGVIDTGGSRSFPDAADLPRTPIEKTTEAVIVIGDNISAGLANLDIEAYRAILLELGTECLGIHTGERFGSEGGVIVGFSRYRLGNLPPTKLIELVVQPSTLLSALQTARLIFEDRGYATVQCRDAPGRIVDRLARPYFNRALDALDSGLAVAAELDTALCLGLGYQRGPIELLRDSGLEHHFEISSRLHDALGEAAYRPARRAQVAAARRSS